MSQPVNEKGPRCKHGIRGDCAVCQNDILRDALKRIKGKRPWRGFAGDRRRDRTQTVHEMADIAEKALEKVGG